mgnify:FL=1
MFKPHYGFCKFCEKDEQMIAVKSGHCIQCNHKQKQAKKKAAGKKSSVYKYVREATGEKDTFHAVLDSLPDTETVCFVCKTRIAAVTVHNFAHILSKKQYPLFRNNPNNIRLLCHRFVADADGFQGCHFSLDMRPRSEIIDKPEWQELFELEERLKNEYKKLK